MGSCNFYAIEPETAGELGEGTVMDTSVHPPRVSAVEYVITEGPALRWLVVGGRPGE